jgi:Bacterial EndoU nuclease
MPAMPLTRAITPGTLLLALILAVTAVGAREAEPPRSKWTATDPPINLAHIDTGEINWRGEAVGYHHRSNGVDPAGARVLRITGPVDGSGVYRARVALRDPMSGQWMDKRASSTFFPDAMSDAEVIEAVLAAFHNGRRRRDGEFIGDSGHGFMIEGWYHSARIVAAYPVQQP